MNSGLRLCLLIVLALFPFLLFTGCFPVSYTYTDISNDDFYRYYVDTVYRIKKTMPLVAYIPNRSTKKIEYIILSDIGVGGVRLKKIGKVYPGSILKIIRILRESPTVFGPDVIFIAHFLDKSPCKGRDVNIEAINKTIIEADDKNHYILNPEYFERITQ